MEQVWLALIGAATLVVVFSGWPKFFTINIHKHYHGEKGDKSNTKN